MSYIFDALQRLDDKRELEGQSARLSAIELLERVERQLTAEQSSEKSAEEIDKPDILHNLQNVISADLTPGITENEIGESKSPAEAKTGKATFGQFQTLPVVFPSNSRLVCCANQDIPGAEAFRLLAVRVRDLSRRRALRRLLITSTVPQEGKSTVSANLACALGKGVQQKVLLIEGDVRRPGLSQSFGLSDASGLCDYLRNERKLSECLYHLNGPGIWILPAGKTASATLEMLQSPRLPALMEEMSSLFDWIVIDSPPALPLADTSVWARLTDGILLVARHGVTKKKKLQKGLESLDSSKLIGVLLNSSSSGIDQDYYYYSGARGASGESSSADD